MGLPPPPQPGARPARGRLFRTTLTASSCWKRAPQSTGTPRRMLDRPRGARLAYVDASNPVLIE